MKRISNDHDMLEEYDFSHGVRGKYAQRHAEGINAVVLEPDVAEFFPDHESVNEPLRSLISIIKKQRKKVDQQPVAVGANCQSFLNLLSITELIRRCEHEKE